VGQAGIPLRSYLVITGGSAIDRSTLMGKGVGEIASRCAQLHIPCLGLAGVVAVPARQRTFAHLGALTELTSVAEARAKAPFWLRRLAHQAALGWPGA
jgi:glycerate kinase